MALHVLILIALISATNLNPTFSQEWQQNSELSSPSESISVGENSINNFVCLFNRKTHEMCLSIVCKTHEMFLRTVSMFDDLDFM